MPVRIDDHTTIRIATPAADSREEEIAFKIPSFDGFTEALGKIATSVRSGLAHVRPDRAVVEFGVDVGVESGELTAVIVKGTGAAHVRVTLEWESGPQ